MTNTVNNMDYEKALSSARREVMGMGTSLLGTTGMVALVNMGKRTDEGQMIELGLNITGHSSTPGQAAKLVSLISTAAVIAAGFKYNGRVIEY